MDLTLLETLELKKVVNDLYRKGTFEQAEREEVVELLQFSVGMQPLNNRDIERLHVNVTISIHNMGTKSDATKSETSTGMRVGGDFINVLKINVEEEAHSKNPIPLSNKSFTEVVDICNAKETRNKGRCEEEPLKPLANPKMVWGMW